MTATAKILILVALMNANACFGLPSIKSNLNSTVFSSKWLQTKVTRALDPFKSEKLRGTRLRLCRIISLW